AWIGRIPRRCRPGSAITAASIRGPGVRIAPTTAGSVFSSTTARPSRSDAAASASVTATGTDTCAAIRERRRDFRMRSKLAVKSRRDDGCGPGIAIVARIVDELVVERHPPAVERQAVVGFDDLLGPVMRQHAVADQDAEAARIQERLVHTRDAV